DGTNVPIPAEDIDALARFVEREKIDLTVVGPEGPLARGIVDHFFERRFPVVGPTRAAAQLETSKLFAKKLMDRAGVPTADYQVFDHPEKARKYILTREVAQLPDGRYVHHPFTGHTVVVEEGKKVLVLPGGRKVKVSPPEPLVVKADGL